MKRTQRTSDFLKECIADSLLRLLRTKPLEAITIREITELANVSRVTYYRNFTSKEEVIEFNTKKQSVILLPVNLQSAFSSFSTPSGISFRL